MAENKTPKTLKTLTMGKHEFQMRPNPDGGHRDRECEVCGLDDSNPVHQ